MASWILAAQVAQWATSIFGSLDVRTQPRIISLLVGALLTRGRSTVSRWIAVTGVGADFQRYYYALGSLGRKSWSVAGCVWPLLQRTIPLPERVVLALDDTLTKRYGPMVQGAGIHHNPTPGPADAKLAYGHVWVTIAVVLRHPVWGAIALPLLSLLYVRLKDLVKVPPEYRWTFQTKLELGAKLVEWSAAILRRWGKTVWVVVDGGYTKRPFLERVRAAGATLVGRLRKDAALCGVPPKRQSGQRGRPRKYGDRIDLARRAHHRQGWQQGEFLLYGKRVSKTYKTFLATYRPAGGTIRVVIVREEHGWFAWFCTDTQATVEQILEGVADRGALEQVFHDVKEVHGAGQQQLRNIWANIGAWNLLLWLQTLIELWAWNHKESNLVDRSDRPWDKEPRRPSQADKRNALRRECLRETISACPSHRSSSRKLAALLRRLAALVC